MADIDDEHMATVAITGIHPYPGHDYWEACVGAATRYRARQERMWGMAPAELIAEWFATLDLPKPLDQYTDRELAAEATCWNLTTLPYPTAVEAIAAYRKEHAQ